MCVEPGALDVGVCAPRPPFRPGLELFIRYIISSDYNLCIILIRLNEYLIVIPTPYLRP
jgi:hypothetical protein